jgi:hypothetical protein
VDGGDGDDAGVDGGDGADAGQIVDAGPPFPGVVEQLPDGSLAVSEIGPALVVDCVADAGGCEDVDDDGLVDAWEDLLLDALRPIVRLAPEEPLLDDSAFVLALVGRVFPVSTAPLVVRAFVMIGYSEDYGSCGLTAHPGDSERIAVELAALDDDTIAITRYYTAAHEGTVTDHGRVYEGAALAGELVHEPDANGQLRVVLWPSERKHATYGNPTLCEEAFLLPCLAETCASLVDGADRVPSVVNAGEDDARRTDALDDLGFVGDSAWGEQDFCGGLGGVGCSAPVRDKLVNDPFGPYVAVDAGVVDAGFADAGEVPLDSGG